MNCQYYFYLFYGLGLTIKNIKLKVQSNQQQKETSSEATDCPFAFFLFLLAFQFQKILNFIIIEVNFSQLKPDTIKGSHHDICLNRSQPIVKNKTFINSN